MYRAASLGWAKPPGVRGLKLLVKEALSSIYTYIGRRLSGGRSLSKDGGGGKEETGGRHAALGLVHTPLSVGMYYTYVCVYVYIYCIHIAYSMQYIGVRSYIGCI